MNLFAQCDRCREFAATVGPNNGYGVPRPPVGWVHFAVFTEPLRLNEAWHVPEGDLNLLLCPSCAPIVQAAAKQAAQL